MGILFIYAIATVMVLYSALYAAILFLKVQRLPKENRGEAFLRVLAGGRHVVLLEFASCLLLAAVALDFFMNKLIWNNKAFLTIGATVLLSAVANRILMFSSARALAKSAQRE